MLLQPRNFEGWLYLPDTPWTLATEGVFVDLDDVLPGETTPLPSVVSENEWRETLDATSIEDVVAYARAQHADASAEELLASFVFFVDSDAFLILRE